MTTISAQFSPSQHERDFTAAFAKSEPQTTIILDFDETLWLRNSTEQFLDHAHPKLFVAPLLALLDILKPWRLARLFGMSAERAAFCGRDWCRVITILLLCPWALAAWRRRAPDLAERHVNDALRTSLRRQRNRPLLVASFGFVPIVRPLLQTLLPEARLVAMPLLGGWRARRAGKLAALRAHLDEAALDRAIYLTDHAAHDADVMGRVRRSFEERPDAARYERAGAHDYVPFRYTLWGKHAGRNHVLRVFYGEDWLVLALATLPVSPVPLAVALSLLFLVTSFFIVFEVGYHENDQLGAEREAAPVLTRARLDHLGVVVAWRAWFWAIAVALPGLALMAGSGLSERAIGDGLVPDLALLGGLWLGLLAAARGLFAVFNRIDEITRTLLYLPLQCFKGIFILLLFSLPVTISGLAMLLALPLSRWLPYVIYRHAGKRWETPNRLYRLMLTILLLAGLSSLDGPARFSWLGMALVLGWAGWTARREMVRAWRDSRWLTPR